MRLIFSIYGFSKFRWVLAYQYQHLLLLVSHSSQFMASLYFGGFWHGISNSIYLLYRTIVASYALNRGQWTLFFFFLARMGNGLIVLDSYTQYIFDVPNFQYALGTAETFTCIKCIESDMTYVEYINALDKSLTLYKYAKIELRSN